MRYDLDVSFVEKDAAKALGARWDWERKIWYYEGNELPAGFLRWYHGVAYGEVTEQEEENHTAQAEATVFGTNAPGPDAVEIAAEFDTGVEIHAVQQTVQPGGELTEENCQSVTEVINMMDSEISGIRKFYNVCVWGEVTNYSQRNNGGSYYFSIKEGDKLIPCIMWASNKPRNFTLENGKKVAISGNIEFYQKASKINLKVFRIVELGAGDANRALMELTNRLREEGLFSEEHKKSIPRHCQTVGIVTALGGQAIQDIQKVAKKRNPYVQLVLYNASVQGIYAVDTIVKGIKALDKMNLDVMIVGRGGGSIEELKAYDSEEIARAVFEARTPVISAVGHEGNYTLVDLVSDMRVATPSEAAETVCQDIMVYINKLKILSSESNRIMKSKIDLLKQSVDIQSAMLEKNDPVRQIKEKKDRLEKLSDDMNNNMDNLVKDRKNQLDVLFERLQGNNPVRLLKEKSDYLEKLSDGIKNNMDNLMTDRKNHFGLLVERLHGLSPTAKLVNGFGYISKDGLPVDSVSNLQPNDQIKLIISDGEATAVVKDVTKKNVE